MKQILRVRIPSVFRLNVTVAFAMLCCFGLCVARAEEEEVRVPSPDRKWEYRVIDGAAVIVKAGSADVAVTLPAGGVDSDSDAVLWAPDSRRFAFNTRDGLRSQTCTAYELAGSTWKPLPDFAEKADAVQKAIEKAKAQGIKRLGLAADVHQRRIDDTWMARRWINKNTLELFAYSAASVENEPISGGVLFRVRCDERGGWRVISQRNVAERDVEKLLSGKASER